ncbi:MAG: phosphatidylserine decarboxylase family protein [Thermodesulfobacteriota bacterium]
MDNTWPVAREGRPFIFVPLGVAFLSALTGGWWLAAIFGAFGLFSAWFFRDPDRRAPTGEGVLSPADGTVILAEPVEANRFLPGRTVKISVFMSLFNVHVNRAPLTGRVDKIEYHPGRFFSANLDKASAENEHNALIIETEDRTKIAVIQIAGLIARRIACWVKPGDALTRGQRFGLIRFGSRLDVYLPPEAVIKVRPGQKVKAGWSVLALLAPEKSQAPGMGVY